MGRANPQKSRGYIVRRCVLPQPLSSDQVLLPIEAQRYLCSVLRLDAGDRFIGFDGQGEERVFELAESNGQWSAWGQGPIYQGRHGAPVALIFAVPKGDKLDLVARQITGLGVSELHLWSAERSIGLWKNDKVKTKLARIERVIKEAARQSGRADILSVFPPQKLSSLLTRYKDVPLRLYFDPKAKTGWPNMAESTSPQTIDHDQMNKPNLECVMIVGPEGGLSGTELETLKQSGWRGVMLRAPVLRTETAGVVACALALDRLGYLA